MPAARNFRRWQRVDGYARYRWAWTLKLHHAEKMLLLCFIHHADAQGKSFAGVALLCEETGLAARTVVKARRGLLEKGIIRAEVSRGKATRVWVQTSAPNALVMSESSAPNAPELAHYVRPTSALGAPITTQELPKEQQQQKRNPGLKVRTSNARTAAAADSHEWKKPAIGADAARWFQGRCNYDRAMGHAFQNGATDAEKATFVLTDGGVDSPGIERELRRAPAAIVLPCSILAAFDTARIGSRIQNRGGHTIKRLRELIAECRA